MTRFGFVRDAILHPGSFRRSVVVLIATVGAATALRWALGHAADPVPFVTYFPAIVVCAIAGGWRIGFVSIIASAGIANWAFLERPFRARDSLETAVITALFFASCVLMVAIADTLRRTFAEMVAAKNRADFLNREMRHRLRNTLAIVQATAQQTARSNAENFLPVFAKRLSALANAHDVLAESDTDACDLASIVRKSCAAFQHQGNFEIDGPSCLLPSDTCVPLSLALHELCTNATKYGALSVPDGFVRATWCEPNDEGATTLVWEESGGPEVEPPTRSGLGTVLLTSQEQIGKADLQYLPGGLRCTMRLVCSC